MTDSTISAISPLLLIVTALFIFILVYLRFTSEFFSKKLFRDSLIVLLALSGLLAITGIFLNKNKTNYIRISTLPLINSDSLQSTDSAWAMAEQINLTLSNHLSDEYLIYPIDWTMQALNFDSLGEKNYLTDFAKRIGLDYFILLSSNDTTYFFKYKKGRLENLANVNIAQPDSLAATMSRIVIEYICSQKPSTLKQSQQFEHTKLFAQTSLAIVEKDYEHAIKLAESAFLMDTTFVKARNILADAQLKAAIQFDHAGKPAGINKLIALRLCEGTIFRHDSLNAKAYQLLGRYYLMEEMWQKAEINLTKALHLDPTIPDIFYDFSHLHASRTSKFGYGNKEALLKHAFALNPCYEKARLNLADYLYFNKWPRQAKNTIDGLLKIHPTSIEAWLYLGKMAIGEGDIEQIIPIYNRILEIDAHNVEAFYNLGVFYFNNTDVENAAGFFQQAIKYGDHLESHLYMGHIYESRGEIEKAIAEYRYRIKYKRGFEDPYADEARKRLYNLTDADSALDKYYGRDKK